MRPLEEIVGIGPRTISILKKLGIRRTEQLITYYPFRYTILNKTDMNQAQDGDKVMVDGTIEGIPRLYHINRKLDKMNFQLNTGSLLLNIVIFNRGFLKNRLLLGTVISVIGKYDRKHNQIVASELRFASLPDHVELEPVYHTTYGITEKQIGTFIQTALKDLEVQDWIPDSLCEHYQFLSKYESICEVHHPISLERVKEARKRIKYEELFLFMLKMSSLKHNKIMKLGLSHQIDWQKVEQFIKRIPFPLTEDQQKSVKEIYEDLVDEKRMNRLLQGDVGSGKTIVAIISIYMNYLSGYQSALMAPTEILATQHYGTLKHMLEPYGIEVACLTGKMKVKEKREINAGLAIGSISVVVGTHALISESVLYQNLGLVITDEQHRFGVNQRANLKNKGMMPDILYMSATPIPRTYALTLYGDMDISNIKTRPKGRKEIITYLKKETEIREVLELMYQQLKEGHQVYVIAPLIEESDKIDLTNVYELETKMKLAFGKLFQIGVLHGKLSNVEKEEIMDQFQKNEIQILISTTVIEVGVDVANATMMVVFDSYRFGLSALHQLRGRVGRNDLQSYFVMISSREAERLHILEKTNDGFKVSEEDFLLRGSGDLFGIKQSGDMVFQMADLKRDFEILLKAKEDSEAFLPHLEEEKYVKLRAFMERSSDLD